MTCARAGRLTPSNRAAAISPTGWSSPANGVAVGGQREGRAEEIAGRWTLSVRKQLNP
jgi:hypothetical protein